MFPHTSKPVHREQTSRKHLGRNSDHESVLFMPLEISGRRAGHCTVVGADQKRCVVLFPPSLLFCDSL